MIVSTCRRLRCLSVCQKQTSSIAFSLRYYILKNAAIWLADSILAHNWRARILPDVGLLVISTTILVSISDYFQEKLMTKFFNESTKPYLGAILDPFCPNLGRNEFSWKKELCQFLDIPIIYHCTNYWAISEKKRQTDRWTDGYSDRQADRNDLQFFTVSHYLATWENCLGKHYFSDQRIYSSTPSASYSNTFLEKLKIGVS